MHRCAVVSPASRLRTRSAGSNAGVHVAQRVVAARVANEVKTADVIATVVAEPSSASASPRAAGTRLSDRLPRDAKIARFAASKTAAQQVVEQQRPLSEYMALPASQYSVLDARRIERIDETTFRCYVGQLAFPGLSVEPVLTVSVTVEERGCTISLLSCKLQGSPLVQSINDKFSATMTNVVRWRDAGASASAATGLYGASAAGDDEPAVSRPGATREIASQTSLEVEFEVPGWAGRFLPVASISSVGSGVMQATLNSMVPR